MTRPRTRKINRREGGLAVFALFLLLTRFASGQAAPASGLYQIVSGRFSECCGIAGPFVHLLPDTDEAFVRLTLDPILGTATMQILAEDRLTVFHTTEWIPGSGFTFAFTNGIVSSGHIQFGNPIGPPGPGLASYSYTVGDSLNTLTINGRVTTPILGADVPNQFTHTNVVATLVEAPPSIDRVELDTESIQFHFSGEPPYDYTVEYSDSLVTTNWSALATYRAKLQTIEVTVTNEFSGVGSRFFRLRKDPCYCR